MGAQQILNILLIFRRTHEQILMRKMQLGLLKAWISVLYFYVLLATSSSTTSSSSTSGTIQTFRGSF